jgi:hypothetical protein
MRSVIVSVGVTGHCLDDNTPRAARGSRLYALTVINTRNYKKRICGLQSIIDKCRICGTEGETIEHIISSCTVLAQSEYKKRHDIFAKIIHMNLAVVMI